MINLWVRNILGQRELKDVAEISDLISSNSYVFYTSGRLYMDRNTWRGFNYTYGYSYYQWSQSHGTSSTPNYSIPNSKGFIIPVDGRLINIKMIVDRNNAENVPFQFDLSVIRNNTIINITTINNTNYTTSNFLHDINLNFNVQEGDMLLLSGRKNGGNGTRRYAQISLTAQFL